MSEPAVSALCKIPANPDIAGIGVRIAIYVQNILCLLSAMIALRNGTVTPGELEYTEVQSTTNLILAFAILISSIVQACTLGISSYHGNIVLSMSWMNNTNAFVYFILYLHHKIRLQEGESGMVAAGRAWVTHVKDRFLPSLSSGNEQDIEPGITSNNQAIGRNDRKDIQFDAKVLVQRYVLALGSLHLTLMAALGLWVWSDLQLFGVGNRKAFDFRDANACAVENATIAIMGHSVPFRSPTLRVFSIIVYALFLIPGVNLVAPVILFLATFFACRRIPLAKRWDVLPAYICLGLLFAINIVFIVDIELTRNSNRGLQHEDEAEWGFGQILAILLLLLPLRDLVDAVLARRLKKRQEELNTDLEEAIDSQAFDRVKIAIERGSAFISPESRDQHLKFWTIISAHGALEYFNSLRRTRMTTADKALEDELHAAVEIKDKWRIASAYQQGADLIAGALQLSAEAIDLVFWCAISKGYYHIARYHAPHLDLRINEQDPDGKIALVVASDEGHESLVSFLLENPLVDVNRQDATGRTALLGAAEQGHEGIVEMLLERDSIQPDTANNDGSTPLIRASFKGRESIVKMLLRRDDVEPNASNKDGDTPLGLASQNGHKGIVKLLLERDDIQPDTADNEGRTPLICAVHGGHKTVVKVLLERDDIQPNAADKDGWTPLIWASCCGNDDIVKMLLDRPEIQLDPTDKDGQTALQAALANGHDSIAIMIAECWECRVKSGIRI